MNEPVEQYLIYAGIISVGCIALSISLRFFGFKPDPIKEQVKKETALLNTYYSRKTKDKLWAIHQPSSLKNGLHTILNGISFLCIWYILVVGLIFLFE